MSSDDASLMVPAPHPSLTEPQNSPSPKTRALAPPPSFHARPLVLHPVTPVVPPLLTLFLISPGLGHTWPHLLALGSVLSGVVGWGNLCRGPKFRGPRKFTLTQGSFLAVILFMDVLLGMEPGLPHARQDSYFILSFPPYF